MATSLTPINEALNRSTPGFDALIGAIQNTSDRITRNREFVKQVQAQKELASFQADLEFENRRRALSELTDLEVARQEALSAVEVNANMMINRDKHGLDLNKLDYSHRLGVDMANVSADLEVETTDRINRNTYNFERETIDERTEDQIRSANAIETGTRTERLNTVQAETDISTAASLAIVEAQNEGRRQNVRNTQDNFLSNKYGDTLQDPDVQYVPLQVDEEGNYQPVIIELNGEETVLSPAEYLNYLDIQHNRVQTLKQIDNYLENRQDEISAQGIEGKLGLNSLRELKVEINKNKDNLNDLQNILENYKRTGVAFAKTSTQGSITKLNEMVGNTRPLFTPDDPTFQSLIGSIPTGDGISPTASVGTIPYQNTLDQYTTWMEQNMTYGKVIEKMKDGSSKTDDLRAGLLENLGEINSSWNTLGLESDIIEPRNMVLNWRYNPNSSNFDVTDLWLTPTQAAKQLMREKRAVNTDVTRSQNIVNNPALINYGGRQTN